MILVYLSMLEREEYRMNRIFDITAYGAVGDNQTDCTAAIQAALDDAAACRGVVAVPPGIYRTGKLKLGKGVQGAFPSQ